ncbi:MAG: dTMP kinase, partial [Planctomycetes bacterium]|nr:dTMP kinase [Planctomycetota bacterium]
QAVGAALEAAGRPSTVTFEPTDGPVGKLLRSMLRGEIASLGNEADDRALFARLFAADRLHHLACPDTGIRRHLRDGTSVICARYVLSSLAYEGESSEELARVRALNAEFPVPDLTVYLDCPVDVAIARIRARGGLLEVFENGEKLERTRARYEASISDYPGHILRLDAREEAPRVTARIMDALSAGMK